MAKILKKEGVALWALSESELLEYLDTSKNGLSGREAGKRLVRHGANKVKGKEHRHAFAILLSQLKSPVIFILILAAMISSALNEQTEALVILAIIFLNAILGFIQEYRAERTLRALQEYVSLKAKVKRDGEFAEVDSAELVPGDIVYLNMGDIIPADIRLLGVDEIATDESVLTGESVPVIKTVNRVSTEHSLPQYLHNVAFMGSSVSAGEGFGVVIATGKNTFFGRTSITMDKVSAESDFEVNIKKFSKMILYVVVAMTIFIFTVNVLLGQPILESFVFSLAIAVGITPEVLPIITTIALTKGAMKMAKDKVIIKRLSAIEDLGNMDTLCCDKTGTLTEGRFSLMKYVDLDGKKSNRILSYGILCNSAKKGPGNKYYGDPIDCAILRYKGNKGAREAASKLKVIDINEFDFTRKRMSAVIAGKGQNIFVVKGAPYSILKVASSAVIHMRKTKMTPSLSRKLLKQVAAYEGQGYNVLCLAEKKTSKKETRRTDENSLCVVGFLLFIDPPKLTARESLRQFKELGVNIKVISGDSPVITQMVCSHVGLEPIDGRIITGDELERMDSRTFESASMRYNVFARVTPEQKYRIVSCLNKEGHIVGFLGDGINDAPALKAADVGISVNASAGIAKEAADIILMKKSLRSVVHGIVEGRKTFGNITKYILNTISANYGNMFTVAVSSMFLGFIPLLPSQILLNNFITDAPHIMISGDSVDAELLKKPRRWDMGFIYRFMVIFGLISTFFDLCLIVPLLVIYSADVVVFRTAWFVESSLSEIISTFSVRTKKAFFASMPSVGLIALSAVAFGIVIWLVSSAFGARFFDFAAVPQKIWVLIAVVLALYFVTLEVAKRFFYNSANNST